MAFINGKKVLGVVRTVGTGTGELPTNPEFESVNTGYISAEAIGTGYIGTNEIEVAETTYISEQGVITPKVRIAGERNTTIDGLGGVATDRVRTSEIFSKTGCRMVTYEETDKYETDGVVSVGNEDNTLLLRSAGAIKVDIDGEEKELATKDDIGTGGGSLPTNPKFESVTVENDEGYSEITPYEVSSNYSGWVVRLGAEAQSIDVENTNTGDYSRFVIDCIRFKKDGTQYAINFPKKSGTIALEDTNTKFKYVQVLDNDGSTEIKGGVVGVSWFGNSKEVSLTAEEGGLYIRDVDTGNYTNYYENEISMRKDGKIYQLKFPEKRGTIATLEDLGNINAILDTLNGEVV